MYHNDLYLHSGKPEKKITAAGCDKSGLNIIDLPNELLASIFLHLHEMIVSKTDACSWVVICLVCRHWYQVAVDFPVLWSKIPSVRQKGATRVDHIPLMVERSGSSPLSIYIELTARVDTIRELKDQRVFDRLVSATFWWGILPSFLQDEEYAAMDAPQLRELNIYGLLRWPERPSLIPFSRGKMPLLTTLRIPQRYDPAQIASLCRQTVTHLEICAERMPIPDLYSILAPMTNLEFLSLSGTTDPQTHTLRLSLQHLRKLKIKADITSLRHYLSLFDVSEESQLIHTWDPT